jgi:aminoglycoside phosphotransferase (APT) family kinase protein
MSKMHEHELEITDNLVKSLLKHQCPDWSDLLLKPIQSSGTDHALFRLGNDYVIRLPRVDWATRNVDKEFEWVPKLAKFLKISVSEPIFKGKPNDFYPWQWVVSKWNEGNNPVYEVENEYERLAIELAEFLNELHSIELPDGPLSRRGISLKDEDLNEETRNAMNELDGEMDIHPITDWNQNPVWIHGDFLPGNILIQHNRLSAVIDFSDVGVGDPACDLVIAWSLLNARSRKIFRDHLENIDENTWQRGRGWALSIAVIMLPYYKHTNPVLAELARRMIANTTG